MDKIASIIQQAVEKIRDSQIRRGLDYLSDISAINEVLIVHETASGKYNLDFRPLAAITEPLSEAELEAFCQDFRMLATEEGHLEPRKEVNRIPGTEPHGFNGYLHPLKGNPAHEFFDLPFPEQEDIVANGTLSGWMLTDLIRKESLINGRWQYFQEAINNKSFPFVSSSHLEFGSEENTTLGMLEHCLDMITLNWREDKLEKWGAVRYLFDWLLWSLGHPLIKDFPQEKHYCPYEMEAWDGLAHNRLYQVFDSNYLLLFPDDYFGLLLHRLSDELEQYPRPLSFKKLNKWVVKQFQDIQHDELFLDPSAESGRTLLAASNFSYNLAGIGTNEMLSKAAILNFYLYAPWAIFKFDWLEGDRDLNRITSISKKIAKFKNKSIDGCLRAGSLPGLEIDERDFTPLVVLGEPATETDMFAALQPATETDMFAALQPATETDMFAALQPATETDMFAALQPATETDMFAALQPATETDMFAALQPATETDMFAALQPATETDMFAALQPATETDMFAALQPATETDMFAALQPATETDMFAQLKRNQDTLPQLPEE